MKLDITAATDAQLHRFAAETLLIDPDVLAQANTRPKLLGVIGPAWPNEFINVPDEERAVQREAAIPKSEHVFVCEELGPTVYLKILPTDMPGGKDRAYPCINGRPPLVINRNVLVGVPYAIYHLLQNAKTGAPYEVDRPGKPPEIHFSDVTNYPLSEVTMPPQSEIDAWHAKYGQRELGTFAIAA